MTVYAITDTKNGEQGLRLLIFKLPESSINNRLCIERSQSNFGGRGKDIWWEPLRNVTTADLAYASTDIFGSDLVRVVAFCMGIAICHRQKFGQVWGSTAPLPDL